MVWEYRGSRDGHYKMSQMSNLLQILPNCNLLCDLKVSNFKRSDANLENKGESRERP